MITLRQIEALHWIAELGTFKRAATKLNMSQSAVSKRIQELEAATHLSLFDRSQRGARLTAEGECLLAVSHEMLALREKMLTIKGAESSAARRLRIGVTELTAFTWLPRLVTRLRSAYPNTELLPQVGLSRVIFDLLLEGAIDIIVIPEAFSDVRVSSQRLAEVHNSWMASPELLIPRRTLSLEELGAFTILTQAPDSGSGTYFARWLRSVHASFERKLSSNSLVAMAGLTLAGVGISYLPRQFFQPLLKEGKLRIVATNPLLPPVPYAAMYRNDRPTAFNEGIAQMMLEICDFSTQYQR